MLCSRSVLAVIEVALRLCAVTIFATSIGVETAECCDLHTVSAGYRESGTAYITGDDGRSYGRDSLLLSLIVAIVQNLDCEQRLRM